MSLFRLGLLATLTATPLLATADIAGLYAGTGVWQSSPTGTLGNTSISLENTLNFDEENSNYFFIALEHPIPLLPNLRLTRTDLEWAGQGVVSAGTSLDEVVFPSDQAVAADLDLSHTEVTFYYEILDNIVDLDLGLTARLFTGPSGGAWSASGCGA